MSAAVPSSIRISSTLFCAAAPDLFADLDAVTSWDAVIAAEPALEADPHRRAVRRRARGDRGLRGHQVAVDDRSLAGGGQAGRRARRAVSGLSEADVVRVRRAALVHDLGRLGVPNTIWDKRGPLTASRAGAGAAASLPHRAHAGVLLRRSRRWGISPSSTTSAWTAPGIPAGSGASAMTPAGQGARRRRRLPRHDRAAAPSARPARRPRPPPSCTRASPERTSRAMPRTPSCARPATRSGAAHPPRRADRHGRWRCSGFSCGGCPTRRSPRELVISRRTAGAHVEHIYAKLGVSNRARASLFAMTARPDGAAD